MMKNRLVLFFFVMFLFGMGCADGRIQRTNRQLSRQLSKLQNLDKKQEQTINALQKQVQSQEKSNLMQARAIKQLREALVKLSKKSSSDTKAPYTYRCQPKAFEEKISTPYIEKGPSRTTTACRIPLKLQQGALVMATLSGHGAHYKKTSGMCWFFIDFAPPGEKRPPRGASWVGGHQAWALSSTRMRYLPKGKYQVRLRLQASPGAGCHLGNGVLHVAVFPGAKKLTSTIIPPPGKQWSCPEKPTKKNLFLAVSKGDTSTAECYFQRHSSDATTGAGVNFYVDNQRNTTLHLAAERCQPVMVRLMMRYGGYNMTSAKNSHGDVPYTIAKKKCRGSNYHELLKLLRPKKE